MQLHLSDQIGMTNTIKILTYLVEFLEFIFQYANPFKLRYLFEPIHMIRSMEHSRHILVKNSVLNKMGP